MKILEYLLVIVVAYLLGSLSVSIVMSSRALGKDVRSMGSGNAGATNMARVYGLGPGVLTLAGDMLKSGIAMLFGFLLLGDWGLAASGMACLVGHCYPAYYKLKGGKGVSVGAAIAFAVDWRVALIIIAGFLIVAFASKKVSLGSICAAVLMVISALAFHETEPRLILCAFCMCIVIIRHRENIRRLFAGTEPDFKAGKKKDAVQK